MRGLDLQVCLDDEDFGRELVEEWGCAHLRHAFMAPDDKAAAKAAFGFTAVPYYVVALPIRGVAGDGIAPVGDLCVELPLRVVAHGGPKVLGALEDLEAALSQTPNASATEKAGGKTPKKPIDMSAEAAASPNSAPAQPSFTLDEDF